MFGLYPRLKAMGVPGYQTLPSDVRLIPERLSIPLSWRSPRRVFVNSMADVFHPRVPFDFVFDMFSVMEEAAAKRGHVFQVLTKRPGRAVAWWEQFERRFPDGWPPNIWIGTSVETQKYAPRITVLSASLRQCVLYPLSPYWNGLTLRIGWRGVRWTG
jgi:protein gp37